MQRRSFMAAILAAGVAPATASSGNLMKIFVPAQKLEVVTGFVTPENWEIIAKILARATTIGLSRTANYYGNEPSRLLYRHSYGETLFIARKEMKARMLAGTIPHPTIEHYPLA